MPCALNQYEVVFKLETVRKCAVNASLAEELLDAAVKLHPRMSKRKPAS